MSSMHPEYWLEVVRSEHEERLRAAESRRLAACRETPSPVRRRFGSALIRVGLVVGGPTLARSGLLVPAHHGGSAR